MTCEVKRPGRAWPGRAIAVSLVAVFGIWLSAAGPALAIEPDLAEARLLNADLRRQRGDADGAVADYDAVLAALLENAGATSLALRRRLAAAAYAHTASYDSAIAGWMAQQEGEDLPARVTLAGRRAEVLRYGENPHQAAAFYRVEGGPLEPRPGVHVPESE